MKEVLLLKCGEIVLKGLNKVKFERRLVDNIKRRLVDVGPCTVYSLQSTIYIEPEDEVDVDMVTDAMKSVFGITTICRAAVCEKNLEAIMATAKEYLKDRAMVATTFKVESRRSDKQFPMSSIELSRKVGGMLHDAYPHLVPEMRTPGLFVTVEVRDRLAYVHFDKLKAAGGMPSGTAGKALTLLSGGIDSPVSSYMMAKRGLELDALHFFSYPYTSERAKLKVIDLAKIVSRYSGRMQMHVVPFTEIQEEMRKHCAENLFTIVMRRFMMRIADRVAEKEGCGALITGESLAQVASQTMEAMAVTNMVCEKPVFRPVIGMDKEEIVVISRKIDTYETSILPYEDCCTVFTPKHPMTKPKLYRVLEEEAKLDIEGLIDRAISGIETIKIR